MESQEPPRPTPEHDAPNGKPHPQALTPPYWQLHRRQFSHASVASNASNAGRPPPIILEDHTEELEGQKSPLWAKSVTIENHVVVAGNITGIGNYVVWICKVFTLDVGALSPPAFLLPRRYLRPTLEATCHKGFEPFSEFEALRAELTMTFPKSGSALPPLPPKSLIYKFRPDFLEKRRAGLAYFMNCVLLNPEYAGSPVLKEFIFS
ncbi:PX domain-containing protein ypt35 [Lambiella insularis]|nr:PX domain-containing protein ypt35 [Lambiella insularis]